MNKQTPLIKKNPATENQIATMFNRIAKNYDFLNGLLSLQQDKRWRKDLISMIKNKNEGHFLDVATGTGDLIIQAYKHQKKFVSYTGVDISSQMLAFAKQKISSVNFEANLLEMSAEKLIFEKDSFDCLSISFGLRNVIDRDNALKEFSRVLKENGQLLILEFFLPPREILAWSFMFYFKKILPLIASIFSDKKAYKYLPKSLENFYTENELRERLENYDFEFIEKKSYLFETCKLLHFKKK